MSARTQELYEQASSLSLEETRALAELLWRRYEDEMDIHAIRESRRKIQSGEETTVSLDEVMAHYGVAPKYPAS